MVDIFILFPPQFWSFVSWHITNLFLSVSCCNFFKKNIFIIKKIPPFTCSLLFSFSLSWNYVFTLSFLIFFFSFVSVTTFFSLPLLLFTNLLLFSFLYLLITIFLFYYSYFDYINILLVIIFLFYYSYYDYINILFIKQFFYNVNLIKIKQKYNNCKCCHIKFLKGMIIKDSNIQRGKQIQK